MEEQHNESSKDHFNGYPKIYALGAYLYYIDHTYILIISLFLLFA